MLRFLLQLKRKTKRSRSLRKIYALVQETRRTVLHSLTTISYAKYASKWSRTPKSVANVKQLFANHALSNGILINRLNLARLDVKILNSEASIVLRCNS